MGLTTKQAQSRLARDGANTLAQAKSLNPVGIFAGQFKDAMVVILLIATGISLTMGEYLDAAAIIVVVVLNAILGFIQEYRAEKTLEALKKLSAPVASVYRDGKLVQIPAEQIVRGDVIRLEAGARIPADCRLISAAAFEVDESLLTGESLPVAKVAGGGRGAQALCFMGTSVIRGHALAEVGETGMATEMGKISSMLSEVVEERTPLQKRLGELGKTIGLICIVVCLAVSVLGIIRGYGMFEMLLTGISLAVAAIPEGLPAVVTISLALAVRRIYKQKALVNKLHSVETLGCANVICTDKTGTLTQNKMKVTEIYALNKPDLLLCAALCNNGFDPTEKALLEYTRNIDVSGFARTDEIPFESVTQFMQVTAGGTRWLKGSLEAILPKCTGVSHAKVRKACEEMARKGLRCLAFAKQGSGGGSGTARDCEFLGIIALSDPLRPEIKVAVKKCKRAGIRVIMLTGDHKNTAVEIARQALIIDNVQHTIDNCFTGSQVQAMSDEELAAAVKTASVFARVTPGDKLRIVKALKAADNIVAMTGDGVNDAPAVKEAAIGVAMGITGTDVTKEAAQLVLLDDNFATLVSAVEQGRTIYSNIRKSMRYMLSSNIGEVLTMLVAMLLGLPLVLIPIQILLINLVTDGLPAIALGMEPTADNAMKQPSRKSDESIFAGGMFASIALRGIAIAACTLGVFHLTLELGIVAARTAAMATLGLSQLIFVFECKDAGRGIFNARYRNNPHLVAAVFASAALIFVAITTELLSPVLQTTPLDRATILTVLAFASALPVVKGVGKVIQR
jgi:Ca2+-transporting ATPase